jgi:Tfp pilus assembly protein PilF
MHYSLKIRAHVVSSFLFLCLPLLISFSASGQGAGGADMTGTNGRHTIQGRIYFPSGRRTDARLRVRLSSFNAGELIVFSDPNGSFIFKGLEAGNYVVTVEAGDVYENAKENVYIDTDGSNPRRGIVLPPVSRIYTVDIALRLKPGESAKTGVINAALAAVPPAARDLYFKALAFAQAGDSLRAIEQLKSAVAIYSQFPLALNELGVQYLRRGEIEKAADALKNAVRLAPEDSHPRLNYGVALLNQRKFSEAEEQLRASVNKNSGVPTAHMYLGIALAMQRKLDESESELKLAIASKSNDVALSHRYLAGVYLERHQDQLAAVELENYLKHFPKVPDAEILQQKIKELRASKWAQPWTSSN